MAGKHPESFLSAEAPVRRGAASGSRHILGDHREKVIPGGNSLRPVRPAAQLSAAELTALAPISNVIVYPDRAEVARSTEINVPEGSTTLIMPGGTGSYAPAEEKAINFGYTITYPQEMVIGGM